MGVVVQPPQAAQPIGHVPPAQFEDAYYRQLTESAIST
jgi:hypothetical protein